MVSPLEAGDSAVGITWSRSGELRDITARARVVSGRLLRGRGRIGAMARRAKAAGHDWYPEAEYQVSQVPARSSTAVVAVIPGSHRSKGVPGAQK